MSISAIPKQNTLTYSAVASGNNNASISNIPTGEYLLICGYINYGAFKENETRVGILSTHDFGDGTQHYSVIWLKADTTSHPTLSIVVSTDNTHKFDITSHGSVTHRLELQEIYLH